MPNSDPCYRLYRDALAACKRVERGGGPNCPPALLDLLLSYGILKRDVRIIGRDSLGPVIRNEYSLAQTRDTS